MNTRRSFFSRIAGMVATIAIAPEIAFRARLALPELSGAEKLTAFWYQTDRYSHSTDAEYRRLLGEIIKQRKVGELYAFGTNT